MVESCQYSTISNSRWEAEEQRHLQRRRHSRRLPHRWSWTALGSLSRRPSSSIRERTHRSCIHDQCFPIYNYSITETHWRKFYRLKHLPKQIESKSIPLLRPIETRHFGVTITQLFPFLGAATVHPDSSEAGMAFELLIFAYSMVAMMLQHLHLYR